MMYFKIFQVCTAIIFIIASWQEVYAQDLSQESIGGVKLRELLQNVSFKLGKVAKVSKEIEDLEAKCWVSVYHYPDMGLEVEVCKQGRIGKIRSLRCVKNQKSSTAKGVKVGDELSKLKAAYPTLKVLDPHSAYVEDLKNQMQLLFILENHKVIEMSFYDQGNSENTENVIRMRKSYYGF
jgi:hypothetical protein